MTLDLRQIRQARQLAEHGSFSRAADALGIAQPTLSRAIQALERDLGLPLFARHRHGVEPTDFGLMFLEQAARVAAQVDDLEHEVALAKGLGKGELSVAAGAYAAHALLTRCLGPFAAAHPAVRVRAEVGAWESAERALRSRTADLAVGEASLVHADGDIEIVERLAPLQGHLLARAGHPLARRPEVGLSEALVWPLVQVVRLPPRLLKPFLAARRARGARGTPVPPMPPPFPAVECPTVDLALAAVEHSDALMLGALGAFRTEIEAGRLVPVLHEPWMRADWAVTRLRRRTLGPAALAFVDAIRAAHAALLDDDRELTRRRATGPAPGPRAPR
jgi:DNA-binding transcriptional LysR family regulator